MCSHYQAVTALARFERHFGAVYPGGQHSADQHGADQHSADQHSSHMWPSYPAAVVLSKLDERKGIVASWGLLPGSAKALNPKLSTFNARSETVPTSPTFRGAWANGQRCIVPAEAVYEPDWRSGRHVPTRLQRADGRPLGIAGLWDSWTSPTGQKYLSFTMLTINADTHPLMKHLHKPQDEKRMVVILQESDYDDWLNGAAATATDSSALVQPYPAGQLVAISEPSQQIQDNPGLF